MLAGNTTGDPPVLSLCQWPEACAQPRPQPAEQRSLLQENPRPSASLISRPGQFCPRVGVRTPSPSSAPPVVLESKSSTFRPPVSSHAQGPSWVGCAKPPLSFRTLPYTVHCKHLSCEAADICSSQALYLHKFSGRLEPDKFNYGVPHIPCSSPGELKEGRNTQSTRNNTSHSPNALPSPLLSGSPCW